MQLNVTLVMLMGILGGKKNIKSWPTRVASRKTNPSTRYVSLLFSIIVLSVKTNNHLSFIIPYWSLAKIKLCFLSKIYSNANSIINLSTFLKTVLKKLSSL